MMKIVDLHNSASTYTPNSPGFTQQQMYKPKHVHTANDKIAQHELSSAVLLLSLSRKQPVVSKPFYTTLATLHNKQT